MRNRAFIGAGLGLLSATALTVGVVGPAGADQPVGSQVAAHKGNPVAASTCSKHYSDKDHSKYGKPFKGWVNVRSGPSTSCAKVGVVSSVNKADYHCYDDGPDGRTWTYLRFKTNHYGWVRDDLLKGDGSLVPC